MGNYDETCVALAFSVLALVPALAVFYALL